MRRRAMGACAVGLLIGTGLLGASAAEAAVSCDRSGELLEVEAAAPGDSILVIVDAGEIEVNLGAPACSGGTPTTTNTDRIRVRDTSGGNTSVIVSSAGGMYAPGASNAGDDDGMVFINPNEIEISVRIGSGPKDEFIYGASALADVVRWGSDGINFNVHETLGQIDDADVTVKGADSLELGPGNATDIASAAGGAGTGAPLKQDLEIIDYFGGDDKYTGGAGDDLIVGGLGADLLIGGKGTDAVEYLDTSSAPDPDVRASIGAGTGDDGGEDDGPPGSRDTIAASIERLIGDGGDDRLIGDGQSNRLTGRGGKDNLRGRGGSDDLRAKDGKKDELINCGPGSGESVTVDPQDRPPSAADAPTERRRQTG